MAATVGLKFDLLPQVVGELQGIGGQVFVHAQERRGEQGRVAAAQGMIVVGCRDQNIDYVPLRTDTPLNVALSSYLAHRLTRSK